MLCTTIGATNLDYTNIALCQAISRPFCRTTIAGGLRNYFVKLSTCEPGTKWKAFASVLCGFPAKQSLAATINRVRSCVAPLSNLFNLTVAPSSYFSTNRRTRASELRLMEIGPVPCTFRVLASVLIHAPDRAATFLSLRIRPVYLTKPLQIKIRSLQVKFY